MGREQKISFTTLQYFTLDKRVFRMEVGNQEESSFGERCWFALNEFHPSPHGHRLGEACPSLQARLERALTGPLQEVTREDLLREHNTLVSDSAKGGEIGWLAALMVESRLPALEGLLMIA